MLQRILATVAFATTSLLAQIPANPTPCSPVQFNYPYAGGFKVLRSLTAANPYGMPTAPTHDCSGNASSWYWPVSVTIGDVDNDGQDDLLYCCEQRFLLAVRIKNAAGQPLATPKVIWLYFDQDGTIYKHRWGADRPAIGDFDGDGINEVAAVIDTQNPALDHSHVLAVFEMPSKSGLQQIHNPLSERSPQLRTYKRIDDIATNWTNTATQCSASHAYGMNYNVNTSHVLGNPGVDEIFLSGTASGRMGIYIYNDVSNQLVEIFKRGYTVGSSHYIQPFDVNGDGYDDLLTNGVLDIQNQCMWTLNDLPPYTISPSHTNSNHADTLVPWKNSAGAYDLLLLHDDYDMLVTAGGTGCTPARLWENTRLNDNSAAVPHGQQAVIAKLIDGPDAFGYTGKHAVLLPKGAPIYQNGSVVINRNAKELCIANNSGQSAPVGPRLSVLSVIQFDGGPTEEVLSFSHGRYSVWRLVFDGLDPDLPYHWDEVFGYQPQTGSGAVLARTSLVYDYYAGGNQEILFPGVRGYVVVPSPCP
ncbi:MAG: FG-GAP repeat domain-containing protein [Planctomycetota bacterium]